MSPNKGCNEPECQECLHKKNSPYINHKKVRNKHKETSYKEALYYVTKNKEEGKNGLSCL